MRVSSLFSWSLLAKLLITSAIATSFSGVWAQKKVLVLGDTDNSKQNSSGYFDGAAAMMQGVPGTVVTKIGGIDSATTALTPADLRQANGDPYDIIVVTAVFGGIAKDNRDLIEDAIKTRAAGAFFLFPDQCSSCAKNVTDVTVPFVNNATQWGIQEGTNQTGAGYVYLNTSSTLNSSFTALAQIGVDDYTTLNNVPPNNALYFRNSSSIPPAGSTTPVNNVAAIIVPRSQSYNGTGACMFVISDVNTILDGSYNPVNPGFGQALVNAIEGSCSVDEGSIEITKTLTLPSGVTGPWDFKFEATCDKPAAGTVYPSPTLSYPAQAPATNKVTIPFIPAGANCTIKEVLPTAPANYTWQQPTDPTVPVIVKNTVHPVTYANVLLPLPGSIHVTKQLNLPAGVSGPFDFQFTASCDVGGTTANFGPATMSYPAQTSADITNVPANAVCRVTETLPAPPTGYTWATVAPVDVTVPINSAVLAPFTNALNPVPVGSLRITHALVAPPSVAGPLAISVSATCSLPSPGTVFGPVSFNAPADTSMDIANIPQGASCTINQQLPAAPASMHWAAPVIAPTTVQITAASGSAVAITNTLQADPGPTSTPQSVPVGGWLWWLGACASLLWAGRSAARLRA